jgi:acetolactate synthase-1/2/3 large subunit
LALLQPNLEILHFIQEFIHYLQDTIDQRGIVRGYTVLDAEIRTGKNVKQQILRASQFSRSEPNGPSYLMASRECLEERITPYHLDVRKWKPLEPAGLTPSSVNEIASALLSAKAPVVITTYLGRDPESVPELIKLCETTGTAALVSNLSGAQEIAALITELCRKLCRHT